ncbi:MAG: 23S rRNA (uracil(1939)-C(5))-methyltransferase RlmD [Ectothiorhodospiraceae bacterium]|nr:23S rRNA (uracil(1939)-C(5))-methyltransferase RlmD [Ectothiorhodospiraceae bacterium]MCH8503031.1 23S rRNA (uracil(1939)-C(5))-methyltransferase RlmD [Ectothiorhodospiraceae bacterium]
MGRRRKPRIPREPVRLDITALSHEGRGIAQVEGKTVFVHGALPGERVLCQYTRMHRRYDEARVLEVEQASSERIEPRCPHFGVCGGCSLQHMGPERQIALKQEVLLELLDHVGRVTPTEVLPPLQAAHWGYRRKARLAVKHVPRKGRVLVGFREKHSPYVADMGSCEVLDERVGRRLEALSELIGGLSRPDRVPQIEVAIGDNGVALVFRNLETFTEQDLERLRGFGTQHDMFIYQQPGNEQTVAPVSEHVEPLMYSVAGETLHFRPTDFTQVNAELNIAMVDRALGMLQPGPDDRVLDLFCGLGNFSLPLARRAARVVGVEGEAGLVERARDNAERNGIGNTEFHVANLAEPVDHLGWAQVQFDKVLLDPPRSGALEVLPRVAGFGACRLLYVSCNPSTLARDAGELVHQYGYRLTSAGVMDMFPHTAHVESIALFEKEG